MKRIALVFLTAILGAADASAVSIEGSWIDNSVSRNNMGALVIVPHSFRFDQVGDDKKVVYQVSDPKPLRTATGNEEFAQSTVYRVEGSNKTILPLGLTYLIVDYFGPDKMLPDFENIRVWFYNGAEPPDPVTIDHDHFVLMIEPFGRKASQSH